MNTLLKNPPLSHQRAEFEAHCHVPAWGLFWEMGCGKTYEILAQVASLHWAGEVDGLLVVAPNGVHLNWITDEIPGHCPDELLGRMRCHAFQSKRAGTKWHQKAVEEVVRHDGLAVLCLSYDAFMTKAGKEAARDFLHHRRTFYVLDESRRVKTPGAQRTRVILKSGRYARYRRILNGTPVTNGPFDVYSQVRFLDPHFWVRRGLATFGAFKAHFARFETVELRETDDKGRPRTFEKLIEYRNLDQLHDWLQEITSRVTKEEVLDLPPKLYSKRYVEMTPEQARAYQELKTQWRTILPTRETCLTCHGVGTVTMNEVLEAYAPGSAPAATPDDTRYPCDTCEGSGRQPGGFTDAQLAIVRLLRFQQILCGYLPVEMLDDDEDAEPVLTELPGGNPRLDTLQEVVEDLAHPFIVYARFRRDVDLIMERLANMGIRAVRYDGAVGDDERAAAKAAFQNPHGPQAFVANPAAAAEGLTLVRAKTVIYYSNSFKLDERLQSEDRAHRIGQEHPVQYIDLVVPATIDQHIVEALRSKFDVAQIITGDTLKEWLSAA